MTLKLDVAAFVKDYCKGIRDKDLLARHGLNAKQMVLVVKKLIGQGVITREQYFERSRKLKELE
jgi:hypothetical protein